MNDVTPIITATTTTWDPTHYHVIVITHYGPPNGLDGDADLDGPHDTDQLDTAMAYARTVIEGARIDDSSTMLEVKIVACYSREGCRLPNHLKADR